MMHGESKGDSKASISPAPTDLPNLRQHLLNQFYESISKPHTPPIIDAGLGLAKKLHEEEYAKSIQDIQFYLTFFIDAGIQAWGEKSDAILSPEQAILKWKHAFSQILKNDNIAPTEEQLKRFCQLTGRDKKGVNLYQFIFLLIGVGGNGIQYENQPTAGQIIDLLFKSFYNTPDAKNFADTAFLSRREQITYALENPDHYVISLDPGGFTFGNALSPGMPYSSGLENGIQRLNLIATVCPDKRSPDEKIKLTTLDAKKENVCFLLATEQSKHHQYDTNYFTPLMKETNDRLSKAKSRAEIPMEGRIQAVSNPRTTRQMLLSEVQTKRAKLREELNKLHLSAAVQEFKSDRPAPGDAKRSDGPSSSAAFFQHQEEKKAIHPTIKLFEDLGKRCVEAELSDDQIKIIIKQTEEAIAQAKADALKKASPPGGALFG